MDLIEQIKGVFKEVPKAIERFSLGISYEDEKRVEAISQIVLLPKYVVLDWAFNKWLSWQDIYHFCGRFGRLPNSDEANFIHNHGLSIFLRTKRKPING